MRVGLRLLKLLATNVRRCPILGSGVVMHDLRAMRVAMEWCKAFEICRNSEICEVRKKGRLPRSSRFHF